MRFVSSHVSRSSTHALHTRERASGDNDRLLRRRRCARDDTRSARSLVRSPARSLVEIRTVRSLNSRLLFTS